MHGSTNQIEFRAKIDAFNEAVKRMSKDTSQLDALRDKHQKVCPEPQTLNPKTSQLSQHDALRDKHQKA